MLPGCQVTSRTHLLNGRSGWAAVGLLYRTDRHDALLYWNRGLRGASVCCRLDRFRYLYWRRSAGLVDARIVRRG